MATTGVDKGIEEQTVLLLVSWGKETIQPLQYHSIEIGPYQMSKKVRRCDVPAAEKEMFGEMEALAAADLEKKLKGFMERVKLVNSTIREGRSR